jgi:hypothetical protein
MKPWIKAGLAGGAAAIVLTLPAFAAYFLPIAPGMILLLCSSTLFLFLYPLVGILAAYWQSPPRIPKQGAMEGGLAGLLAFGLDSIFTLFGTLALIWTGAYGQYLNRLVPSYADQSSLPGLNSLTIVFAICSLAVNILAGVFCSALGGFIFASAKRG